MIQFETSVRIDRPRDAVFGVVADPTSYPRWNSAVRVVRPLEEAGGRRFRIQRDLPSGPAENLLEVVTAVAPHEVVVRASDGPTPFTYHYRLRDADGGTELSLAADVELDSVPRVLSPLAGRAIRRGVDENLAALKRLLESE